MLSRWQRHRLHQQKRGHQRRGQYHATQSAVGTNGDSTISVVGSGLDVTTWQTFGKQHPSDGCLTIGGVFWGQNVNQTMPTHIATYNLTGGCVSVPSGAYSITWVTLPPGENGMYGNGTILCNSWTPADIGVPMQNGSSLNSKGKPTSQLT